MRRFLALLSAFVLVSSLAASSVSAVPAPGDGRANSFVGSFDIVEGGSGVVLGHVVASFKEPTADQLVPGRLDIDWSPDLVIDPYWPSGKPFVARESHGQILRAWFWDDTYPEVGHTRLGRVQGYLCDYITPQNADCHGFQMAFADIADPLIPNQVGFGTFDSCCDGQWHNVGEGSFVLNYVGPTEEPAFLTRQGTGLFLGDEPFHELAFDKYDLLYQFVQPSAGAWGFDGAAAGVEALRILGEKGYRVVRVATSPYAAGWFEDVFFDDDPGRQAAKRQAFFAGFDAMLDAADRYGIRIVADLLWQVSTIGDLGHHSLREAFENRQSLGRQRAEEYVREVVSRYRDRATIAMWEIGNEWNLVADIQWPVFDITSDQVATAYREIGTLIRDLDSRHLITSGNSAPRPSAMHLLRAVRAGEAVDWTPDSAEELTEYLALINPDPIDIISIHYADDAMVSVGGTLRSPENLRFFAQAADEIGKPLFVGEIGALGFPLVFTSYNNPEALDMMRATLPVLVELKLPLTLYWTFNEDSLAPEVEKSLDLRYGVTNEALRLIDQASRTVRR